MKLHYLVEPRGDSLVTRIVSAILNDVTDRRGWRHQWDGFDDDIREAIIDRWIDLVRAELDESKP